jgi:glycosyltransferase involved in cell wall biosynthesis
LNQGRFIERTIRSVLGQEYLPLEYVVYDGGSTDGTLRTLAGFADRLILFSEVDRGQADAVNKGIRATSGDVICWLNSDDVYAPGSLASVASFMAAMPDVDVVYGDAQLIDADDRVLGTYYTEPWNPGRLPERCFLCQPAVFFRRHLVNRFGLLDESLHYCLDYEYWLRLAAGGARFAYLPRILAHSRVYPETKTLSARLAVHQEINAMLRRRLGRVPETWLLNHAHTLVELDQPAGGRKMLPYALRVVLQALRLSLQWNRSISRDLLRVSLGPIASGARQRVFQSRSAGTSRPAN